MKPRGKPSSQENFTEGLDSIFRGLGDLLQTAAQFTEKPEETGELNRSGSAGPGGLRAVYGVSVRVAPGGKPLMERFGNVRHRPGEKPTIDDFREPMTDLLDEEDHVLVIAELPGMEKASVHWKLDGQTLIIDAQSDGRRYHKKLSLPCPTQSGSAVSHYKNGILEIKLWKQASR